MWNCLQVILLLFVMSTGYIPCIMYLASFLFSASIGSIIISPSSHTYVHSYVFISFPFCVVQIYILFSFFPFSIVILLSFILPGRGRVLPQFCKTIPLKCLDGVRLRGERCLCGSALGRRRVKSVGP